MPCSFHMNDTDPNCRGCFNQLYDERDRYREKATALELQLREEQELRDKRAKMFFDLENELEVANRLVGVLKNALEKFGEHKHGCDQNWGHGPCSCGLEAAMKPCSHEFVNQPLRGGWFCLNCNVQKAEEKRSSPVPNCKHENTEVKGYICSDCKEDI